MAILWLASIVKTIYNKRKYSEALRNEMALSET